MPSGDHERRLTIVELNCANTLDGICEIKEMLSISREQRTDMMSALAVIKNNQEEMKAYQTKCDDDRAKLQKAVSLVKNYQDNQKRNVATIAGAIGLLVAGGGKILEKIGHFFS